jgi:hypothetical protein
MSFEPISLPGVRIDERAPVASCNFCGGPIWWGRTARGRRNPFDVRLDGGMERTTISHWSTCPERDAARAAHVRNRNG